jgi:hypothetical protein
MLWKTPLTPITDGKKAPYTLPLCQLRHNKVYSFLKRLSLLQESLGLIPTEAGFPSFQGLLDPGFLRGDGPALGIASFQETHSLGARQKLYGLTVAAGVKPASTTRSMRFLVGSRLVFDCWIACNVAKGGHKKE